MDKVCPLTNMNIKADIPIEWRYCDKSECAWWSEDAQKCAMLVIAEAQRKAVKAKWRV